MSIDNLNYAEEKWFDYDNHLTNEVKRSLVDDWKIDQKEAEFMSKIIDKYNRRNIKIKKRELVRLANEFWLNYRNLSKIWPKLESLIRKRAEIIEETKKESSIIKKELAKAKLEKKDLDYYTKLFKNYKGIINWPKTLNLACEKLNIDKASLQRALEVKDDSIIWKITYRAFKWRIIDWLKYSHKWENWEILQTKQELEKARERIEEIKLWKKFWEWLTKKGPKWKSKGECWKWVYKNINNFFKTLWIETAIKKDYWRHWTNWDNILENPSNLDPRIIVKKIKIDFPKEAPIGSIINYESWKKYAWSEAKKEFWHVEIVWNDWYYYDWKALKPWGSAKEIAQSWSPEEYKKKTWFSWYAYQLDIKDIA